MLMIYLSVIANSALIEGIVIDEQKQEFIPYAGVAVKNSGKGIVADSLGRFRLETDKNSDIVLVISHINYYKKEYILGSVPNDKIRVYLAPKNLQTSDVIVSASLYEEASDKLSKSASVISHEQIVSNMGSNLVDMVANTPGFTQVWEYHSPIILRGLNSNRLVIMKDGNRRIGTFPGGYFGQDVNIYDTKKVEIVKGPGAVVYGSGAISGIINIISNDPFGEDISNIKFMSGYGSNNDEFLEMLKYCYKKQDFGISLNGKFRTTSNMQYGNGETADNSNVEDKDISLNTGYRLSENQKMILNLNYHYGDWGKPRGFNGPTKRFTEIRNVEESIHSDISYSYNSDSFWESFSINLYYDDGKRDYYQYKYSTISNKKSSLDLVHYKDEYFGGRMYGVLKISANNKLTIGIDGYKFYLDNPSDVYDYYNNTQGRIEGSEDAGQDNIGAFLSNQWQIAENFRIEAGIRFDVANVYEGTNSQGNEKIGNRNAFSGNLGMVYSIDEFNNISLNFGRAFRMPTSEELFTKVISCKGIKIGNSDLDPEYSQNIDLGVRGSLFDSRFKYELALFYMKLDGFINESISTVEDIDFTYQNTDAKIAGGEISLAYRFDGVFSPSNNLYLGFGASYVYGEDLSGISEMPLFGIPPLKINTELEYRGRLSGNWISGYNIKFNIEYSAAQNRIPFVVNPDDAGPWGYVPSENNTVLDIAVGINSNSLPCSPKLRLNINNVFDSNYQPFGSFIPAMGRNIKVLLLLNI